MRIGIVSPKIGLNDGQGRVNFEIAEEALRRGHQIVLFCEEADPQMVGRRDVIVELMPAPDWLPTRLLKDQLFAWRTERRLLAMKKAHPGWSERNCNALLVNGFVTWANADVNAVHFVHRSWRDSPLHPWRKRRTMRSFYKYVYNSLNAGLERGAFRRSPSIVAVSEMVRLGLIESGVPSSAITTIVSGVDAEKFRPGAADRTRFGLPQGSPVALFAGDLRDSRKNLDTVLKAMVDIAELHLAVAGRHEGTSWPRIAEQLGLAKRVHFLGFQQDMPEVMRAVDLFVFPSRYDPFGLVILEAMASGLPVITARGAGGAGVVTSNVGIVLDDSDDVSALTRALRSLASCEKRRQQMARDARAQALQYSWVDMASRYIGLLEDSKANRSVA